MRAAVNVGADANLPGPLPTSTGNVPIPSPVLTPVTFVAGSAGRLPSAPTERAWGRGQRSGTLRPKPKTQNPKFKPRVNYVISLMVARAGGSMMNPRNDS